MEERRRAVASPPPLFTKWRLEYKVVFWTVYPAGVTHLQLTRGTERFSKHTNQYFFFASCDESSPVLFISKNA